MGGTLPSPGPGSGDPAYLVQTDSFFSGMTAWGDTIWGLWTNNMDVAGAAPVMMTNTYVQLDVSDTDGDGIPAYWEIFHFGGATNANPYADGDYDGSDNYSEYIALTDPSDGNSSFRLSTTVSNSIPSLSFMSYYTRTYTLSYTTNLISGTWSNLIYQMPGIDGEITLSDPETNLLPQAFFRVRVDTSN